ncbi:hypothetical protein RJ641_006188 [Dillenia turbinata]|uniref:SOSS complex subunit B homolog n=1 Tax=Dillenia turbinata TaxID=194707 RepID=A0AAN8VHN2_9MAGN
MTSLSLSLFLYCFSRRASEFLGSVSRRWTLCLSSLRSMLSNLSPKMIALKDLVPAAQNNINTQFILVDKGKPVMEGQQRTCLALVADKTAAVHFLLWGDECDAFEPGDIVRLSKGIFSYNRNNLVLRAGKRGQTEKVGEFAMVFVETPNLSEIHWVPDAIVVLVTNMNIRRIARQVSPTATLQLPLHPGFYSKPTTASGGASAASPP